jgi:PleD family two-component response regulator
VEIEYDKIYKEADDLLYEAKKSVRNHIKVKD